MTPTDIGILLIVLCVLLWAILAALHRHTVQLNALGRTMEKFFKEFGHGVARDESASGDPAEKGAGWVHRASRKS